MSRRFKIAFDKLSEIDKRWYQDLFFKKRHSEGEVKSAIGSGIDGPSLNYLSSIMRSQVAAFETFCAYLEEKTK